jgi:hypothetical protein
MTPIKYWHLPGLVCLPSSVVYRLLLLCKITVVSWWHKSEGNRSEIAISDYHPDFLSVCCLSIVFVLNNLELFFAFADIA